MRNPNAPNLRSLLVSRYQYRVHYEIRGDEVWIVHIRHTARRPYEPET
jgi:toxin ParE1/3/4